MRKAFVYLEKNAHLCVEIIIDREKGFSIKVAHIYNFPKTFGRY